MGRSILWVAAVSATALMGATAQAGRLYSTAGTTVTEAFDTLPNTSQDGATTYTGGANLVTMQSSGGYSTGWVNDTDGANSADAFDVGVTGVHLWHYTNNPTAGPDPSEANTGPGGHSRYNQGGGSSAGTGGFVGFVSGATPFTNPYSDKAIGSVLTYAATSSSSIGFYTGNTALPGGGRGMMIGYELVNTTGTTLTDFTVTYDGEQYMDGRAADPDSMSFSYSLNETAASYITAEGPAGTYTNVPALNFVAPNVNDYTTTTTPNALVVDGNDPANRQADITATVTGVEWAPGTSLFLRWTDFAAGSGSNDGLAIDNLRFSAVPEPTSLAVLALGGVAMMRRRRTA